MRILRVMALGLLLQAGFCIQAESAFSRDKSGDELTRTTIGEREVVLYVPERLPPTGSRALVLVLHGGLGNADRIVSGRSQKGMNLNTTAEKYGFIVAYLNGTKVARLFGSDKRGWNGGGCCGLPAKTHVDDVGYIRNTAALLMEQYGVDRTKLFGIGHSNGGIMLQRMVCEAGLFSAIIPISGPLSLPVAQCPAARGIRVLAIQGVNDENVPIGGGKGKGLSGAVFNSAQHSKEVLTRSGADYTLDVVDAEHKLDTIETAIMASQGITLAEKAARFFNLTANP